jgi:hypothetical protein
LVGLQVPTLKLLNKKLCLVDVSAQRGSFRPQRVYPPVLNADNLAFQPT